MMTMSSDNKGRFLVMSEGESIGDQRFVSSLQRISLMHNNLVRLPERVSQCTETVTLLLQGNRLVEEIPQALFESFPALRILNVSETKIKSLPTSTNKLYKLHTLIMKDCKQLTSIPSLEALLELQLIDLSGTAIKELPQSFGLIKSLVHLFLRETNELDSISIGIFCNLVNLATLDMTRSVYQWKTKGQAMMGQAAVDCDVGSLLENMAAEHNFRLRYLEITGCSFHRTTGNNVQRDPFPDLNGLVLMNVDMTSLDDLKLRLQAVNNIRILRCSLTQLSSSKTSLSDLEKLTIDSCAKLAEFFSYQGETDSCLPNLHYISLMRLPELRNLCREGERWSRLETVLIEQCGQIERLPIGLENCFNIKVIRGETIWWDTLSWNDDITKDILASRRISPDHLAGN